MSKKDFGFYVSLVCLALVVGMLLFGCGGGGPDEAPGVAEEAPKYHVPATPDPCTTTYPCEKKS